MLIVSNHVSVKQLFMLVVSNQISVQWEKLSWKVLCFKSNSFSITSI